MSDEASYTECIGAIDQGTQSTRFFLFDTDCNPLASHQVELPQIYPHAGWCEHDPMEIWRTVQEVMDVAYQAAESKHGPLKVLAVGITNQRETTVLWDRETGLPLHNAIVWLDNRTSDLCTRMSEKLGSKEALRPLCGLPISPYFSATKWLWMLENVPEVSEAVAAGRCAMGTVDSWILYRLSGGPQGGVHITDVSNASRTMLMSLTTCDWHPDLLEAFQVPPGVLPTIASNSEVYGYVRGGPMEGVPIAGCLGDQQAAMLGQRCAPGEAKNTFGTGCFLLLNTGHAPILSTHGLLTTLAFKLGAHAPTNYALEGSVAVAGMGVSWLKDNLGVISSPMEIEPLAASVPDTGGLYFVPAFSGLFAPRWDASARGIMAGLTGFSTRAHLCRALLEAICFQAREVLDAMRKDAQGLSLFALRADGGAAKNNLLMQLQADLLQVPVLRPFFQETTSLGAALAAGMAVGVWSEQEVFGGTHALGVTCFSPSISPAHAERRFAHWNKAVSRCVDLADLADPEPEVLPNGDARSEKSY